MINKDQNLSSMFVKETEDLDELNIIFITDQHDKTHYIEKLKHWYITKEFKDVNLVILGGDFDNLENEIPTEEKPDHILAESKFSTHLSFLEFFSSQIYYVPGNHDAPQLYYSKEPNGKLPILTPFSHNVHKNCVQIAKDLYLIVNNLIIKGTRWIHFSN